MAQLHDFHRLSRQTNTLDEFFIMTTPHDASKMVSDIADLRVDMATISADLKAQGTSLARIERAVEPLAALKQTVEDHSRRIGKIESWINWIVLLIVGAVVSAVIGTVVLPKVGGGATHATVEQPRK